MTTNQSVIYVMSEDEPIEGNNSIAQAQIVAIEHELPMSVVRCIEPTDLDELDRLLPVEARLAKLNIPLLVLIGEPSKTLPAVKHHLNPIIFTSHSDEAEAGANLQAHPHNWPGTVIKVSKLKNMIDNKQNIC